MKKNLLHIAIIFFVLFSLPAVAEEISFSPEKPTPGAQINFEYNVDKGAMGKSAYFVVYAWSATRTEPEIIDVEAVAEPGNSKFVGSMKVPEDMCFGLVKFMGEIGGKVVTDDNYGLCTDIFIRDSAGKPLEYSNMLAALTRISPGAAGRTSDFTEAVNLLEKEVELYPANITAQIGLTSFLFDIRKINYEIFKDEMNIHLAKAVDMTNEREVTARVRALKTLNRKNEAERLTKNFIKQNPECEFAETQLMNNLARAESLDEFAELSGRFMKKFPNSSRTQKVSDAIVKAFLQNGDMDGLREFIAANVVESSDIYLAMAQSIPANSKIFSELNKTERLNKAITLYNKALSIEKDNYRLILSDPDSDKNSDLAYLEKIVSAEKKMAFFYEVGGDLYILRDTVEAIKLYENARKLNKDVPNTELYRKLYNVYAATDNCKSAYETISEAVIKSAFFSNIGRLFVEAHKLCKNGTEAEAGALYKDMLDSARTLRLQDIADSEIRTKVKGTYLKNLDDRVIELSDFRDKITILFFRSSWCGPCQAVVPALDAIYDLYKRDPEIIFAAITVWEEDDNLKENIKEYKEEYEAEYPLLYDDTDLIMRNMSLTGLPSAVILDKEGTVRFKLNGFTSTEEYVRNITDMVDYIASEQ